jgi:hypothetical protein
MSGGLIDFSDPLFVIFLFLISMLVFGVIKGIYEHILFKIEKKRWEKLRNKKNSEGGGVI